MIKDTLQDIVAHTHALGFLPTIKITGTDTTTSLESIADDKSVIMCGKLHNHVPEFEGTFGLPNLDKLNIHLKCPEYGDDGKIEVITEERNGKSVPTTLHFENYMGDYVNDYRFINTEIINEKIKNVKFAAPAWIISFEPSFASIARLKYQSQAHSHEWLFQVSTSGNNLMFSFGDAASHAGNFVFHNITKEQKLKYTWSWPVQPVIQILSLVGDKTMNICDAGAMQITVDSGIAEYKYILPAQSK